MQAIFGDIGADLGQFGDLVTERLGVGARRARPQPRHAAGLQSTTAVSRSGGTSSRVRRPCPGCPPRLFPDGGLGGRRLT